MAENTTTEVALDHLAPKIDAAREARRQAAELIAFAEDIEEQIKTAMGTASKATLFGVPVFTYAPKNAYAWRKFQDAHPHIARQYIEPVVQDVLNREKLLAEQGDLLAEFQTREFRWVSKKPGA